MKKVTITKNYLDSLKDELARKKKQLAEVEEDRQKFRTFFLDLLKENVSMASKNQYYSPETMINRLSKLMNRVENWWWQ